MPVAEFEVVADALGFVDVVAVVALRDAKSGVISGPCLIHVVHHLVARGGFRKSGRLRFVARALLFALIAIEDAERDGDLKSSAVVGRGAIVFAANGGIGGA